LYAVPIVAVDGAAPVKTGAVGVIGSGSTVSVKDDVAAVPTPLAAVTVNG